MEAYTVPSRDTVVSTLQSWVDTEFLPWRLFELDPASVEERLRSEARRDGGICLFRIRDGLVDFAPFTVKYRPFMLDPQNSSGRRGILYLQHLRDVVRLFGVRGSALIGLQLSDLHIHRTLMPVFCYQKPAGARNLMLPDIDLLVDDYCRFDDNRFNDSIPFETKRPEAVFIGSTTGIDSLTLEDLRLRSNPRIDAAMFFRDQDAVTFELPTVVQCDGPDTEAAIRGLDIGDRRWSWTEQQAFRYMVSLDGNGATCSRVAIALHGHQVLAKYASPHMLYYFHGLRPWRHYIPINQHGDVLDMVAEAASAFDLHRDIASESRRFAQSFLTRLPIMHYTALMLSTYIRRFAGGDGGLTAPAGTL